MTQNTLKKLRYALFCTEGVIMTLIIVTLCVFMPDIVAMFEQLLFDLATILINNQVAFL